jgi:23S rRNA (adenine2503-C2)-methyltransferase
MVKNRFPDSIVPVEKFKIQFARMGDPAFNPNVIEVLKKLPDRYRAPGLMPCISTVAPRGTDVFFKQLLEIKQNLYRGNFQMQFSIHSTNLKQRNRLIPIKKWQFDDIARYGERFHLEGERKIALNFALAQGSEIEPDILLKYFNPEVFIIKITPVNPTYNSEINQIKSHLIPGSSNSQLAEALKEAGYEVLISIGELKENEIGSNCGQYVFRYLEAADKLPKIYCDLNRYLYQESNHQK